MKNFKRGFTLVELIVVITILAILGSIAFISLQGYSADARNSKRTSDLGSIESAMSVQLAEGKNILSFVTPVANNLVPATNYIAGVAIVADTDYNAGSVNYAALNIKSSDFQDPDGKDYVIGITTKKNGKHEIAASMEQGAGARLAKIVGDYTARTTVTGAATAVANKITITNSTDINKFFIGDNITDNTNATHTITQISPDGTIITVDTPDAGTITSINLSADEATSLIYNVATGADFVTDGGTVLPY